MDNFFDILIYIIIIISIFSPLFKKKEPKPPIPPQRRREPDKERISAPAAEVKKNAEEYDILKEIETLFNKDKTPPPEVIPRQSSIEKAEIEKRQNPKERLIKSESTRTELEIQPSASEHKLSDWTRKINVDDAISRKAEHFSQILKERSRPIENEHIRLLRQKLKNPATLKDYIIFSEIFGKPKALRR